MSLQVVPLTSSPNQQFETTLQVDGSALTLGMMLRWSDMAGYWVLTIFNSAGDLVVDSIPLITGWYPAANILCQYGYLKIGSAYIINKGNSASDYPGVNDLGSNFVLLWGDTPQGENGKIAA